ncbi:MAG: carbamoyl-phosphate synthase large subunit, partial [Proteobacteria bacterium]|nr:carbamoyl-phosphate synthase large subunit [Pseudomonadota bacterium]
RLTTQMKSVGEVMAIGRTFQESLQKALRGLEVDIDGLSSILDPEMAEDEVESFLNQELSLAGADRLLYVGDAYRRGYSNEKMFNLTKIDPWFLVQIEDIIKDELALAGKELTSLSKDELYQLKRKGFSDSRLAGLMDIEQKAVREYRQSLDIRPVYKRVDTCAAEFSTSTAYMYSTYEEECEADVDDRDKIVVLGGGPNRIGQGIEFDYCCVHAAFAMRDDGYETIMINCNPETVSTDYDTSDRLYFEPLTLEDVLEVLDKEKPKGVIVQYGGQTPLKLARDLEAAGVPVIGTTPDCIDLAEDRERFQQLVEELGLKQPPNRLARSTEEAVQGSSEIGFPLVVRPSYVLGGRAMEIVYNETDLKYYMRNAVSVSNDAPVLLDRFLDDAVEVDVDAICDGEDVLIGSIMEHIEQAGVHSGDSACSLPPYSLSAEVQDRLREQTRQLALKLGVVGLMNIQFAIQFVGDEANIYLLEVNPRASRTVPFVSKATGVPLAKIAARCMAGVSLKEQGVTEEVVPKNYAVKESVFPFVKFPGVDPLLGPEMKSTGEVMGVGETFGMAFAKAQLGAGVELPTQGRVFLSVRERDRDHAVALGRELVAKGFEVVATSGTGGALTAAGIEFKPVNKVYEGRPHIVDMIKNGDIALIINTT